MKYTFPDEQHSISPLI